MLFKTNLLSITLIPLTTLTADVEAAPTTTTSLTKRKCVGGFFGAPRICDPKPSPPPAPEPPKGDIQNEHGMATGYKYVCPAGAISKPVGSTSVTGCYDSTTGVYIPPTTCPSGWADVAEDSGIHSSRCYQCPTGYAIKPRGTSSVTGCYNISTGVFYPPAAGN